MQPDWYRHFFHGVALDLWRQAVTPAETEAEAAFLARTLAPDGEPAPLLDVPCGNGRHALALAARGHRVTGVDLAPEFVAEARARAAAAGLPVEIVEADMRALPADGRFAGAYCFGNSFGYLDHDGTRAFLAAVAGALASGGRFVLQSGAVAETLLPSLQERRWWQAGDIYMLVVNRYDAAASRLDTDFTFMRAGAVETRTAHQHVYTAAELGRLCAEAGLAVEARLASVDGAPFTLGARGLVLVARKG